MQAIRTRYCGPTDTRGSRIIAKCEGGSITVPYDYSRDAEGNHRKTAEALLACMGWEALYIGGVFDDDYYWVASNPWDGLTAEAKNSTKREVA